MELATLHPRIVLEGELAPQLSRWLCLVKWLLAIPHYVVLVFLWIAFFVLTVVAFFVVLFTGRTRAESSSSTSAFCAGRGESRSTPSEHSALMNIHRSRSPTSPITARGSRSTIRKTCGAASR